jgi:hypothetical protein
MTLFTDNVLPRGYYISVKPVTVRTGSISFEMFTGISQLLLETARYSDKQFGKAIEMSKAIESEIIAAVIEKYKAA